MSDKQRTIPGICVQKEHQREVPPSNFSKVLIIYVGGTIGMKKNGLNGYEPVKDYLYETLKSMPQFHDPEFYQEWLSSKKLNGFSNSELDDIDERKSSETLHEDFPCLVTAVSVYGKRIFYQILEYDELLDSSNMTISDWVKIASDIERYYKSFDAFIVLHGSDTMVYTASALSFMLENLGKTVILTGSQIPITEVRNDAAENLLGALTLAGHFILPEVGIYFGNQLLRGNRSLKISAIDFKAFDSPNLKPLINVGVNFDVHWDIILRPNTNAIFSVHKNINPNVGTLRLFPGITESTVRAFLSPPIQGIVLETFGVGNAPNNRPDLLEALKEACDRGVVIVNCTQCLKGSVSDLYATGKALSRIGIIPGADMTTECALTKLSYLLGKYNSPDEIRLLMTENLRGEMTIVDSNRFSASEKSLLSDPLMVNDLMKSLWPAIACKAAASNTCSSETLKKLDKIKSMGFSFNCFDDYGVSPLHVAVEHGNYEITEYLLLNGASVHAIDPNGSTPLYKALIRKKYKIVKLLRETGAYLQQLDIERIICHLEKAAIENDLEFLENAIECQVSLKTKNNENRNLLHLACTKGNVELVKYLLQLNIGLETETDIWGHFPIDNARQFGFTEIVELLSK